MTSEHGKPLVLSLSSAALLTVSQGAVGCALGILFSDKLDKKNRTLVGLGFISLALATTVPALVAVVVDLVNGPSSKLGVRRRLRSIRERPDRVARDHHPESDRRAGPFEERESRLG